MKKTLIIGASTNPQRYSFLAANRLVNHGYPIVMLGLKEGQVAENQIQTEKPILSDIDTVTLYIGPGHQPQWYEYVINLKPKRVIFNPGTENEEFEHLLKRGHRDTRSMYIGVNFDWGLLGFLVIDR